MIIFTITLKKKLKEFRKMLNFINCIIFMPQFIYFSYHLGSNNITFILVKIAKKNENSLRYRIMKIKLFTYMEIC